MKAKFNTSCVECGELIKVGKEIARNHAGKWIHKHCMPEIVDLP